jgi:outer membrane protein OmpA-like peptidoglycan-associated protein
MKSLFATVLLIAAAALPAAAGPDFVANTPVSKPLAAAAEARNAILPQDDVAFEHDSDALIPSSHQQIETTARWLKGHASARIVLEGHADSIGTDVYNEDLATRRAESVRRHLIGHGIAADRILVLVYGEADAKKIPSPIDRRVVLYASTDPVEQIVQASLIHRNALTAMWTDKGVLFTETHGTHGIETKRKTITRR